jgi:hypothetical protein
MTAMTGDELRARIQKLGVSYTRAAELLGLSRPGLYHQLRGETPVSRRTVLLLAVLERGAGAEHDGSAGAQAARAASSTR